MLNKDLVLVKDKRVSDIIVGDAPFMPGDKPDELWPTWFPTEADPFWEFAPGERSNNIELLTYDAGTYLWIGNPRNATTTRTLTFTNLENGLTATFTIKAGDIESNTVAGDALGLYGYPFQTVRMRVNPSPYRMVFTRSLKEGVVNAQQGITDGRCKKSRYSTSNKWWQRCTCNGTVQRRGIEGFSGQHGHCKRQGSVCGRLVSKASLKHARRRGSMVHHRHLSGRNVCVYVCAWWWSKLTSQEALYA